MKKQRGITLVALVITIVILVILAGISISTLTNQGIFTQTQKAKRESEIANIKEQIQLDIYEKQLEPPLGDITQEQLKTILGKYGTISYEEDGITIKGITTEKGYEILLSEIYSGITTETKTLLADKVNVGDYVTYTPDTASTTGILSELSTYSGNTDSTKNTADTLTQETGLKWRVLDVVDGKVRLISEVPTTSTVALKGYNGYNNAVYLLDKTCKTLYSKVGYSENVQNLKIEDIQKYMIIKDYSKIISNYGQTLSPACGNYPIIFEQQEGQTVNGITGTLGISEQISPINQTTTKTVTSWTVKQIFWYKNMEINDFIDSMYYNLFIKNVSVYSTYWMSSRYNAADSSRVGFGIRIVGNLSVKGDTYLYDSWNNSIEAENALRPVITLNSNVLAKSGNGTSTSPYEMGL